MNKAGNSGLAGAFIERLLVVVGLIVLSAIAWIYTIKMAQTMGGLPVSAAIGVEHAHHHMGGANALHAAVSPHLSHRGWSELWMTFSMWAVMMAAMMLPTAIPMILAFLTVNRRNEDGGRAMVPVWAFTVGYLIAWTCYSAGATVAQSALLGAAMLSPATLASGPLLGGILLMAAGVFQWTPWKDACMSKCRNPMGFLLTHWRPGNLGALRLGSRYGAYCVGCCWLLMLLSFALGVMNLAWMAVLTVFMLVEKIAPSGRLISRIAGIGLIGWGGWMILK